MKKTLHIIPHSHWDREWYMPFEKHRVRLLALFDDLIQTMEENPDYTFYHMDGQYIPIEDYLAIRPHQRERLLKLIREGRIRIGPWYVLQDEYLTSGEANVRNMLYGTRLCRALGAEPAACGYFPDAFGNVSQAPQILRGFGIDNAVFGRGTNERDGAAGEGITTSELIWRAPDGSDVLGVYMANWYCNAMELPTEKAALGERLREIVANAEKYALTEHLLGMNGCDHQPVQTELVDVIRLANQVQDAVCVKQSNFAEYIAALRPFKNEFPVYEGEINGQRTKGSCPLICTASAHMDIKQDNHGVQHLLERVAEPLAASAMLFGGRYDQDLFLYAWKTLMQNHPHDSICTCSCDEVYDEMKVRFAKSRACAEELRDAALSYLAEKIDTMVNGQRAILVFSSEPNAARATVKVNIDFDPAEKVEAVAVFDDEGNEIPSAFRLIKNQFTYTLPRHTFRTAQYVDRFEIELQAEAHGIGYKVYTVKKQEPSKASRVKYDSLSMENEFLTVEFNPNGTINVTDKRSGERYLEQHLFEDTRDEGDLYNYVPSKAGAPLTSKDCKASVSLHRVTPFSVTFRCAIPLTIDADIISFVTLSSGIARVDFETAITNRAENHRLRALFPAAVPTDSVFAEGQFDVVRRAIAPSDVWQNPCNAQRMQAFVGLEADAGERSLLLAGRGLCEYEALRDGKNTLALTLLRAVGEIGDWGIFPTPKGQMQGSYTLSYSFVPYQKQERAEAYALGYGFAYPSFSAVAATRHEGSLPTALKLVSFDNEHIRMTAFKKCEDRKSIILRFFNTLPKEAPLTIATASVFKAARLTDLDENALSDIEQKDGAFTLTVGAKKIVTVELLYQE